ncbi:MAG: hypothetical protein ICV84_08495 [Flavisolibacter sp.]|nr:hypothetical protein [Flavisolibacter sp.]
MLFSKGAASIVVWSKQCFVSGVAATFHQLFVTPAIISDCCEARLALPLKKTTSQFFYGFFIKIDQRAMLNCYNFTSPALMRSGNG